MINICKPCEDQFNNTYTYLPREDGQLSFSKNVEILEAHEIYGNAEAELDMNKMTF